VVFPQHPIILATRSGLKVQSARIEIYRKLENGEKLAWTGSTDEQGVARPTELDTGSYRVLAYSGELFAVLRLSVGSDVEGVKACEVEVRASD